VASPPLLSLSTDLRREIVTVDDQPHELRLPGDLTLQGVIDFRRLWIRTQELEALDTATQAEIVEYELVNLQLAQLVLPSASELLAQMKDASQHQALATRFLGKAIQSDPRKWGPLLTIAQLNQASISATSSPDSSGTSRARSRKRG